MKHNCSSYAMPAEAELGHTSEKLSESTVLQCCRGVCRADFVFSNVAAAAFPLMSYFIMLLW